jgi:hypothetical protein
MWFQGRRGLASVDDPDVGITADPLVIWPCLDALVDELPSDDSERDSHSQYYLGFAPDAITKANVSGGDGPHIAFGDASMDAPLLGDDWEGVPFVTYLRTVFAWGGFPGLRDEISPPRDLLELLREGLAPI